MKSEIYPKLRHYQQEAVHRLVARKKFILADDMGIGKTATALCAIDELGTYPCLIVCPTFAIANWIDEIEKWLPGEGPSVIVYAGTPKQRKVIWDNFKHFRQPFMITTYGMVNELAHQGGLFNAQGRAISPPPGTYWEALICDEISYNVTGMLNHKTATYKVMEILNRSMKALILISGTPMRKGVVDLYTSLHLVDSKWFKSYWGFVECYCTVTETPFGREIERTPANLPSFRKMLENYMIRRLKTDVMTELPPKTRQVLKAEMTKEQRKMYEALETDGFAEISEDEVLLTPNAMSVIMRQRQLLCAPNTFGLNQLGGALEVLMQHSHIRLDADRPIVVFTPFLDALDSIQLAFQKEYPGIAINRIQGGLSAVKFGEQWQTFQKKGGKRVLICSIASSASFQAYVSDTAYFVGYDWDFTMNCQAEDRLWRNGQEGNVTCYYILYTGTVDDAAITLLNDKKGAIDLTVGTEAQFKSAILQRFQDKSRSN